MDLGVGGAHSVLEQPESAFRQVKAQLFRLLLQAIVSKQWSCEAEITESLEHHILRSLVSTPYTVFLRFIMSSYGRQLVQNALR